MMRALTKNPHGRFNTFSGSLESDITQECKMQEMDKFMYWGGFWEQNNTKYDMDGGSEKRLALKVVVVRELTITDENLKKEVI